MRFIHYVPEIPVLPAQDLGRGSIGIMALFLIGAVLVVHMIDRQATDLVTGDLHAQGGRYSLALEVAATSRQRRIGLMGRESLAPDAGMLFVYDDEQAEDHAFWMYRTKIPLDIAFLDQSGTIRSITRMNSCMTDKEACPRYPAGATFWMALELNVGFFDERGVEVGDRLEVSL